MNIPSPSQYYSEKGLIIGKRVAKLWHFNAVMFILADQVYVGDMVQGKAKTVNQAQVKTHPDE